MVYTLPVVPAQTICIPLIVTTGKGCTVTFVTADVAMHPFASVTLTEYVPVVVTLID